MENKLKIAAQAAREAGQLIIKKKNDIEKKIYKQDNLNNFATQVDLESEELILSIIKKYYPEHAFYCEETQKDHLDSEDIWIIDPIDGTNNYVHQIPQFSVSIGYAHKKGLALGVVYDPSKDEMFHAIQGQGAFLNGNRVNVSRNKHLSQCIIGTGFYYDRGEMMKKTLRSIEYLFKSNIRGIRRYGSAALDLCWVACGRFDAFYEFELAPWDYAAGKLIAEEAGGKCSLLNGKPKEFGSFQEIMVTNSLIHDEFLEAIQKA